MLGLAVCLMNDKATDCTSIAYDTVGGWYITVMVYTLSNFRFCGETNDEILLISMMYETWYISINEKDP